MNNKLLAVYSGIVTVAAIHMYAHIRHVEGWMNGMQVALDAQLEAEKKESKSSDNT